MARGKFKSRGNLVVDNTATLEMLAESLSGYDGTYDMMLNAAAEAILPVARRNLEAAISNDADDRKRRSTPKGPEGGECKVLILSYHPGWF